MYKIQKKGYFFTVTDTATGFQEINEARNLVKWTRNDDGNYVFLSNVPLTEDVKTMFVLGTVAKEFAFADIIDGNNVAFASVAVFEDFLGFNTGFIGALEIIDGIAFVENSTATYSDTVNSTETLVLPDTTINVYVNEVFDQSVILPTLDPSNVINITA